MRPGEKVWPWRCADGPVKKGFEVGVDRSDKGRSAARSDAVRPTSHSG